MGGLIERSDRKDAPDKQPAGLQTAYSIADLRSFPADITSLQLMDSYLTNADLAELARFKALTYLDISQCDGEPNDPFCEGGLQVLARLTNLEHLELRGTGVTDHLCETLSGLKGLRYLSILQGDITDAGVRPLGVLPRLETLEVRYCERLTDASLRTIGAMHGLRRLNIPGSGEFSDAGLKELGRLDLLEYLFIGTSRHVTSHGFAFLSHLPALTELSLSHMPLNDEVLEDVSHLTQLKSLDLGELSGITDAGLLRLHTLSLVEWLCVYSCPRVTPAGLRHLKEALPGSYTVD